MKNNTVFRCLVLGIVAVGVTVSLQAGVEEINTVGDKRFVFNAAAQDDSKSKVVERLSRESSYHHASKDIAKKKQADNVQKKIAKPIKSNNSHLELKP